MVVLFRHIGLVLCLLLWVCSSCLQFIANSATGHPSGFQIEQNEELQQKAIAETAHGHKRDTVRRAHAKSTSLAVSSLPISFVSAHTPLKPNGQTAICRSSRPLHQRISLYLI